MTRAAVLVSHVVVDGERIAMDEVRRLVRAERARRRVVQPALPVPSAPVGTLEDWRVRARVVTERKSPSKRHGC